MTKLMLVLIIGYSIPSYACSCEYSSNMIERFANAEIIFSGKVLSVQYCELEKNGPVKLYSIAITNSFKGDNRSTIQLLTGIGDGDCGDDFTIGEDYVIFGYDARYTVKNDGLYETNICMWNILPSEFPRALEYLSLIKSGKITKENFKNF
ncbi:hypothetical protein [Maribacter dokdonensis]|uniref:hypothetical protein n=1 Tax=Maribacter dokdonensis TaxID=320912 RepID=UPI003297508B